MRERPRKSEIRFRCKQRFEGRPAKSGKEWKVCVSVIFTRPADQQYSWVFRDTSKAEVREIRRDQEDG